MENVQSSFTHSYEANPNIIGLICIREQMNESLLEPFDNCMLIVTDQTDSLDVTSHYIKDGMYIQERWINRASLSTFITEKQDINLIKSVMQGDILMDRDGFLADVRKNLNHPSKQQKEYKLFVEFSLFYKHWLQGKMYIADHDVLDAYSEVLKAIHHWGRLVLIEAENNPDTNAWNKVREINPGVYKLYEELTSSNETLQKRIELILLACEFSLMSKMKKCSTVLFNALRGGQPLGFNELKQELGASGLDSEISLVLKKLLKKGLIKKVVEPLGEQLSEVKYTL